ncbi:MAG: hypothetical protein QOC98_739 [Frankiaceae bacterium]|nr:hypothetical protein [Frankiaceae bacterium]
MALRDKLHALDHNFFPGTRDAEEDAETYLRRVAASRVISPAQAGDVMAALREYLGVEPQDAADEDEDKDAKDEDESEDKDAKNESEAEDKSEDKSEEKDKDDKDE